MQNLIIEGGVALEGAVDISGAKTAVAENASNGTAFDQGFVAPSASSNLASLTISQANGSITATTTSRAGNGTIIFVPTSGGAALVGGAASSTVPTGGSIQWACNTGTVVAKYRPAQCR